MEMDEELKTIQEMLDNKDFVGLRTAVDEMPEADIAAILEEMPDNKRLVFFRLLKKNIAAEVFSYLDPDVRNTMVEAFSDAELTATLEEMALDDAADLLEDMPASLVKRILARSSKETRDSLNKLLRYPENSAGSIMTPELIRLRRDMTVADALEVIREEGIDAETIYTSYVVEKNHLLGVVTAKDLLLAKADTLISDIMSDKAVVTVQVTDDREFVANEMNRYGFMAMPVVDGDNLLVGIVTIDDATDVLIDEATEDFEKMAAINPSEEGYFATSVWQHVKNRIPWLFILMFSATFTGMLLNRYEQAFAVMPILVGFIPMLMDTGGNCGNQSSTLMIRGMALEEIEPKDIFHVVFKEVRIAGLVGLILGFCNGVRIFLLYHRLDLAVLVSLSLFAAIIMANLVGSILPLGVKKLGLDPAMVASPCITTIVDACAIMVYFMIAVRMFPALAA